MGLVFGSVAAGSRNAKVLELDTMSPVVAPFTGSTNPIRGINGGGVPWKITEAQLELPSPCVAPIVFVTNGTGAAPGAWFAATGTP